MTCTRIHDGVVCHGTCALVPLEQYGARVWLDVDDYFGPSFYRSAAGITEIRVPSPKTWRAFEAWQRETRRSGNAQK